LIHSCYRFGGCRQDVRISAVTVRPSGWSGGGLSVSRSSPCAGRHESQSVADARDRASGTHALFGRHDQQIPGSRVDVLVADLEPATARQDDEGLRVRMVVRSGPSPGFASTMKQETGEPYGSPSKRPALSPGAPMTAGLCSGRPPRSLGTHAALHSSLHTYACRPSRGLSPSPASVPAPLRTRSSRGGECRVCSLPSPVRPPYQERSSTMAKKKGPIPWHAESHLLVSRC